MDSAGKPPIIKVWELLRDPILSFYQDGMEKKKIEGILQVIRNSCHAKKYWYAPVIIKSNGHHDEESQRVVEEQHTAFCTWLLGRLFCILGKDSLSDMHSSCVKAQIEIIEVCAENQFMTRSFFVEYISCLADLLSLQTSEHFLCNGPQLLKRFTPLPLQALDSLNLEPKYILITSKSLVLSLEKYLIEIIDSMVPFIVLSFEDLIEKCWFILCQVAQVASLGLKLVVLKTFSKIVSAGSCNNRTPKPVVNLTDLALAEICHTLKVVALSSSQILPISLNVENETANKQDLITGVADLINVIVTSGYCLDATPRIKDLLAVLQVVITTWDFEKERGQGLKTACRNVIKLLDMLPPASVHQDIFSLLLKKYETQEFVVNIIENCICGELVIHIKSTPEYCSVVESAKGSLNDVNPKPLHIEAELCSSLWAALSYQIWDEVAAIQTNFPIQPSKQAMQEINDLVGKLQTLIRCAAGVEMMIVTDKEAKQVITSVSFLSQKIQDLLSFFKFIIDQLISLKSSTSTIWFSDTIVKSILLAIRYLLLLPEMCSQLESADIALSIAIIPWIENYSNSNDYAEVPSLFPETKCESMKIISLHALANIFCPRAEFWKSSVFGGIVNAINDPTQEKLVVEAIQALPVLLLDPYQQQIDVLQNLLRPIFESSSEAILTAISAVFCSVVCILSGNVAATIFAKHEGELFRTYVCLSCHKDFPRSPASATNVLKSCKDVLSSCMTLLTCKVVAVRRNMAACLDSLVSHLPAMYKPEAVQTWMKYAEDEDHQVRIIFSEMVKFLIFSRDWIEGKGMESEQLREEHIPLTQVDRVELSHSRPRLDCVLQLLYTGLLSRMSEKNTDSDVQGTLRATIVDIGCVPLDCVLRPVLKIVLVFLSHPEFSAPSIGHYYLQRIAKAHNTNVVNLYHRFQTTLCQVLVCGMGMNCHKPLWTKFMDKVIYGLGFESTTAWLRHSLKCILPSLVVYVVKFKHTAFLMKIIELLTYSPESVIKENFQFIYPFVFLNEPDHIVDECVGLMEEMSKTSAQQLILSSFKTIHNELLLHYHCKKERVEEGICQLIDVLEEKPKKHIKLQHPPKQADIAKHLEQRFLGVLVHFDMLLESSSTEESNKINALQSLPHIIRLMGSKYITPVRLKVLSTLRTALRLTHCDFPHLSCGAWEAFIQSVDIRELGPLLGTVAASLLPLLDQFPDEVSYMLKCLVEKFEYELAEHIPDLFFLPDTPVLHDVYKVVQLHIMKKRRILNESQNLEDYLQQPLRFITHDNVDIRRHGLDYLLSLLKEKQADFTKSLLQDGVVHDDVAKLLSLLIEGCRDTDVDIQRLCVENLGMIGALDPGHLPHKKPEIVLQITSVDEDRFAVQALIALAKAYQAARNTRFLDSFAVAIQNLLKHYKISSQPSLNRKKLWDSFPLSVQQVMTPLENSSYFMTSMQSNLVWPHPLFGTRYALTLTNWAHTWACRIVTFIEDSHAKDMFTWCIPSLKRDINCVLFFLPFILLYAVMSGNVDQHRMMVEEMTFIIHQHSLREEEAGETTSASEKFQMHWAKSGHTPLVVDSDSATYVLCAKTVFSLLDFMEKWLGMAKKKMSNNTKATSQVQNVQKFLSEFSKLDLAYGNYAVNEYARALMYLEDHLMEHKELLKDEEHLSFLERVFAQLNEPDGIKGVLAIQCSQPKLLEAVVFHEVAGQHQEALACFELLAKEHSNDDIAVRVQKGMIRCCLYLDQPYAALHIAEGALLKRPEYRSTFLEAQAECFWRVSNFENLEGVLKDPQLEGSNAWGVNIGKCLMDIRHRNQSSLREHLCSARSYLSKVLSTASLENGSYLQGYPHVIKLHMLQELEEASKVIDAITSPDMSEQSCRSVICNLIKVWEDRLALVQATSSVQESLLRLRRCLLQLTSSFVKEEHHILSNLMDHELGTSWLKSAEVARISGCYQQAYVYLLNAEKYKPKRHFIELAKLHWNKKEQDHALATLRRGLDQHFPNSKVFKTMALDDMVEDRKICAEAKLLVASYNDKNMNVDVDLNVSNYKDAVDVYQQWEKSHASLAQYYDRISLNDGAAVNFDQCQTWAVAGYLKSLRFGCNLIYHSMSRLLTIWLDFGKTYQSLLMSSEPLPKKEMASKRDSLFRMNQQIEAYVDVLPAYMFMTGFSQLVSRMCHPMAEVNLVIKRIIVKLLISYPQQTMWMLVAMNRSSYVLRKKRCKNILEDEVIRRMPNLVSLIADFTQLGNYLAALCQELVPKELSKTNVSSLVPKLPHLLASSKFNKIMVPLQRCRILTLPQQDLTSSTHHLPFPVQVPYLVGIREEVTILSSLQRPRKVSFRGSDGHCYDMMCKNKDDLRLDARVMEFSSIVNKYLQKDPASRSRSLNIRTYSVVPLNEDCGLIEWVPNLSTYRGILNDLYKEMGLFISNREIRKYILDKDAKLQEKKDMFLKHLVPKHPPVFRNWFRKNFTDSRSWFEARKSYVHTLAVMSMVGYMLGLGDRHGENILLDTTCGDIVHVDFNCLFNKGERFECPERVPFRLTHNMVSAMGPTGVEGPFRIVCEITLDIMRELRDTLLSVLQPFVYDPKVDEHLRKVPYAKTDQKEVTNDFAVENVKNIQLRLSGCVMMKQQKCNLQLSVEGQAQVLIQEATSIENLCQMYIGWGAYL